MNYFYFAIVDVCNDLVQLWTLLGYIILLIQIIVPIILIISGMITMAQSIVTNDEGKIRKNQQALVKKIIAAVLCFLVITITKVVIGLIANNVDSLYNECIVCVFRPTDEMCSLARPNLTPYQPDYGESPNNNSGSSTNNTTSQKPTKLIFVGDSRTVGMKNAVNSSDIWSCETSKGLSWMKSTGIPNIENNLDNKSGVIILMGINDVKVTNSDILASNYADYINDKANTWASKGVKVYFVSVMPTKGTYDDLNSYIDKFNSSIKKYLSSNVTYIDANSYLDSNGFSSSDGLHYDSNTYKNIYNYIKQKL